LIGSTLNKGGAEWIQHPNLGIGTESFGVYPECLRVNSQILSVNTPLLWSTLKFGGQSSNLVVNPQILGFFL